MLKIITLTLALLLLFALSSYVVFEYSIHYTYIIVSIIAFIIITYTGLYINRKYIRLSPIRYFRHFKEKTYPMVKLYVDDYLQCRKYHKFISQVDSCLTRTGSRLNCRDIYLIFCDKSMEDSSLLRSSGGCRVKNYTQEKDFKCWDVNGYIYFEMITDSRDYTRDFISGKNTVFAQCVEKYILDKRVKSIIVCEQYDSIMKIGLAKNLSAKKIVSASINSIHAVLNDIIPVQLVVTGCHSITGLSQFYQNSNMKIGKDVIRYISNDNTQFKHNADFLNRAFEYIYYKMGGSRLSLPLHEKNSSGWSEMYSAPESVQRCKNNIGQYINSIIGEVQINGFSPFAGLYFSIEGGDVEKISNGNINSNSNSSSRDEVLIDSYSDGKILSSYVTEIRHTDRVLVTKKSIYTNAKTISAYTLTAIYASVCLITSLIFINSYQRINYLSNIDREYFSSQNHATVSDKMIYKFGDRISRVDYRIRKSWLPSFGFYQPEKYLEHVKNHYVDIFQHTVLKKKNQYLDRSLDLIGDVPDSRLMAYYVEYLRGRIINNQNMSSNMENRTSPIMTHYNQLDTNLDRNFTIGNSTENINFTRFIRWQENDKILAGMIAEDRKRLYRLVFLNNKDDAWIYGAITDDKHVSHIGLSHLFPSQLPSSANSELRVDRVYSTKGRDSILKFLNEVGEHYSSKSIYINGYSPVYDQPINTAIQEYDIQYSHYLNKYNKNYLLAWKQYLTKFSSGFYKLFPGYYKNYTANVTTNSSVYEKLLLQAYRNLLPIRDSLLLNGEPVPVWLVDIMRLGQVVDRLKIPLTFTDAKNLKDTSGMGRSISTTMTINKYYLRAKNTLNNIGAAVSTNSRSPLDESEMLYSEFVRGLSDLIQTSSSTDKAFALLTEYFQRRTSSNESLIQQVMTSYTKIDEKFFQSRKNLAKDLVHAQLLDGMAFVINQSKIHVQNHWGILYKSAFDIILSPKEKLEKYSISRKFWIFYNDFVSKLIIKNADYVFRNNFIKSISTGFSSDYLQILSLTSKLNSLHRENYNITIKTVPTEIKTTRGVLPAESKLTLVCNQKNYEIQNKNYPFEKEISIDPLTCTEITIDVYSGSFALRKKYVGDWCYFDFRKQFSVNSKVLKITDMKFVSKQTSDSNLININPGFSLHESKEISLLSDLREMTLPKSILSTKSI